MAKYRMPFAAAFQTVLVGLLLLSFVLIAQQSSKEVYGTGMKLLIGATLIQIPFGNVPPTSGFRRSIFYLAIGLAIVAAICVISVQLVPYLLKIGR